jgi:hypothetical protein
VRKRSLALAALAAALSGLLVGSAPFASAKPKPAPNPGKQAVVTGTGGAAASVDR